jgi:hypothetical protein
LVHKFVGVGTDIAGAAGDENHGVLASYRQLRSSKRVSFIVCCVVNCAKGEKGAKSGKSVCCVYCVRCVEHDCVLFHKFNDLIAEGYETIKVSF